MAFFKLCDDKLVTTLRDVFNANIVRVPEERVRPLAVVASSNGRSDFRGALALLLKDGQPLTVQVQNSRVAAVSGKRSRQINLDLGLQILGGFLQGFGIPSAGLAAKFSGASTVSFTFQDVNRAYVDTNELGGALTGRTINQANPAASIFFGDDSWDFLAIDSVITSKDFAINIEQSNDNSFKLDVSGIQQIVSGANVGVTVSSATGTDLTFHGDKELTFAFSCVRLFLKPDGTISSLPPDLKPRTLGLDDEPQPVLIHDTPGMLSWES